MSFNICVRETSYCLIRSPFRPLNFLNDDFKRSLTGFKMAHLSKQSSLFVFCKVWITMSACFRSSSPHYLIHCAEDFYICILVRLFLKIIESWVELNLLLYVTINDISVIYVTAHRCAGGRKKKLDLRSDSQRHRHFVGFFNVPVLAPTRDHPFYTVIPTHHPI